MKILALETGGRQPGLAALQTLSEGPPVICALTLLHQSMQLSRDWPAAMQQVLDTAGWNLEEIELLAVAVGPGSWTGLRIGLSAARALAQVRGLPLKGVATFAARAGVMYRTGCRGEWWCLAPCRPGHLYRQMWDAGSNLQARGEEHTVPIADLDSATQPLLILPAGEKIADLPARIEVAEISTADCLCEIAGTAVAAVYREGPDDPLHLLPRYGAPSAAERNLQACHDRG